MRTVRPGEGEIVSAVVRRSAAVVLCAALVGVALGTGPAQAEEAAPAPEAVAEAPQAAASTARPGAANTGVPVGRTLTPMAGGTVALGGTTIADRVIEGDVTFTGDSLTLRNVRVTGHAIFRGSGIVVEDSEFGSLALSGARSVRLSRVEVFGRTGQDGMHITSDTRRVTDVLVEDTWIHNPLVTATSHYDGIQVRGVDRLTLRRVSVELGAFAPQHNAALFLENANGGNAGVRVESSWLLGGGYVLYAFGTQVAVRDTVFGEGRWGHLFPSSWLAQIVEFAGNRDPGGTMLGLSTRAGASIVPVDSVDRARKSAFVRALYEDFLGRAPSESEVLSWVSRLDGGMTRYEVATSLARTDQWLSAVITRFYRDTLGREPDASGLAFWIRHARDGMPMSTIAASFYSSHEYLMRMAGGDLRTWVEDLYAKLLYRRADPGGLANWLAALRSGAPRTDVAVGFYQAAETTRVRVNDLYLELLGRSADPSGLATWGPLVRAQGDIVLAATLAASNEYFTKAQAR